MAKHICIDEYRETTVPPPGAKIIYNIGNSSYHAWMRSAIKAFPGIAILHDFFLGHEYRDSFGPQECINEANLHLKNIQDDEDAIARYPFNKDYLLHCTGIAVHSNYTRDLCTSALKELGRESLPILVLPHFRADNTFSSITSGFKHRGHKTNISLKSFGSVQPPKFCKELAEAWAIASKRTDSVMTLTYVGAVHDDETYSKIISIADQYGLSDRVEFTGYVDDECYAHHLITTDIAIQLRRNTRGESSGAIAECLSRNIPTIVNSHGPMKDLDASEVFLLPEDFGIEALASTLERMVKIGPEVCRRVTSPSSVMNSIKQSADSYADKILSFASQL